MKTSRLCDTNNGEQSKQVVCATQTTANNENKSFVRHEQLAPIKNPRTCIKLRGFFIGAMLLFLSLTAILHNQLIISKLCYFL
jgi:hypothetical protein